MFYGAKLRRKSESATKIKVNRIQHKNDVLHPTKYFFRKKSIIVSLSYAKNGISPCKSVIYKNDTFLIVLQKVS